MEEKITVGDIIPLKQATITKLTECIDILSKLSKDYVSIENPHELESLKKEFNSHLQYMASLYAKTKSYKGPNHTYLEVEIKKIKAISIQQLLDSGKKITQAEHLIYAHEYYVSRMLVVHMLIEFFTKVEAMYDRFNTTLQCIIQSVSIAGKDLTNSKLTE